MEHNIIYSIQHIRKYINMTKHTNKNKEVNRLCVTFEHPEILQEFNNYFYNKYNTVRGYRLQVLEDLIANFNETQTITKQTPQILKDNKQLTHDKQKLEDQLNTATTTNKEHEEIINTMTKEIEDLKQQLQHYEKLHEDNIRLEETNKKQLLTIDHLTEKLEETRTLQGKYETLNQEYNKLLQDNKEEIKTITKEHEEKLTKILHDNKEEIKQLTAYTIKLNEDIQHLKDVLNSKDSYIKDIKNLNPIDRLLKNYPKEAEENNKLPERINQQ